MGRRVARYITHGPRTADFNGTINSWLEQRHSLTVGPRVLKKGGLPSLAEQLDEALADTAAPSIFLGTEELTRRGLVRQRDPTLTHSVGQ